MTSTKDHVIVLKRDDNKYHCKCEWVGDLKGACEHAAYNQVDLTKSEK
jgi:hypothetical protein